MSTNMVAAALPAADEDILTPLEVAARLRLSKRAVLYHLNKGVIPGRKIGNRWIVLRAEVERILSEARGLSAEAVL